MTAGTVVSYVVGGVALRLLWCEVLREVWLFRKVVLGRG